MSNLLFDERPLVVSPKLAVLLGDLDKAVILQQIHYWLERSANLKDGYKWVYNSMAEWNKQFPWIAIATLKRKFKSLEDENLLITGNYNRAKFDKTKWYRINYDALNEMVQRSYQNDTTKVSKCDNEEYQNDTTNTIDYTEITTEITTKDILSGKPDGIPYSEIIDYLNQKTGKKFKATTDKTKRLIKARFKEGFEVADFKQVVDNQTQAWLHDSKMAKYLRPETLFGPKFEGYLNSRPAKQQQRGGGINGVYF